MNRLSFLSETRMEMDCMSLAMGSAKAKRSLSANFRPQDVELQDTAVFVWEIRGIG